MTIYVSTTFAHDLMENSGVTVATQIGSGTLLVYSGSVPAGPDTAITSQTVLATFALSVAASQVDTSGVLALSFSNQTVVAGNTGTATFFRILNSSSVAVIQGTVNTSGGDFNLSSTSITSGDNVTITGTGTITFANIS